MHAWMLNLEWPELEFELAVTFSLVFMRLLVLCVMMCIDLYLNIAHFYVCMYPCSVPSCLIQVCFGLMKIRSVLFDEGMVLVLNWCRLIFLLQVWTWYVAFGSCYRWMAYDTWRIVLNDDQDEWICIVGWLEVVLGIKIFLGVKVFGSGQLSTVAKLCIFDVIPIFG